MSERTVPGELVTDDGTVTLNEGRETAEVRVANRGDRPVQVGSHFHFFEANAALAFDRAAAFGRRLNVPAGTAVRFEPGDDQTVELVDIGGKRRAHGMNGLVNGTVGTDRNLDAALERLREAGFADTGAPDDGDGASGDDAADGEEDGS